jgi:two-component system cell cycle sensor histidine kinase/response regulator CckA
MTSAPIRVLFVDDDPALCIAAEKALRRAGFEVTTATNSLRAMNFLDSLDGPVHALITDIRMPSGQPHGFALARIARYRHPEVVVAYITGYPDLVAENAEFVDGSTIFEKPIDMDVLAGRMSERLASIHRDAN